MNEQQLKRTAELMVGIPKSWRALLERRMEPYGLSQAKWMVLYKLDEAGEPLPQVELATRIGIEPATLVRLLDRMEAEGLTSRQADPNDRRCKHVVLQERAQEILPQLRAEISQLRQQVLQVLTPEELATFQQTLARLQEQISTLSRNPEEA